jgi:hypothetical protein
LEEMYAARIAYLAATTGPNRKWRGKLPIVVEHFQAKLARDIAALDASTIRSSMALFEKMDPWLRYWHGSELLAHYGRGGLPEILRTFRNTNDCELRGVLLGCVRRIALIRQEYDRDALLILAEGMRDHRGSWPLALPPGPIKTVVSELAEELAIELVDDPHVHASTRLGKKATKEQQAFAREATSKWLSRNLKYLYVDPDTGKFRLDKQAAASGKPTKRPGVWPVKTLPEKLRCPRTLDSIKIPKPGG